MNITAHLGKVGVRVNEDGLVSTTKKGAIQTSGTVKALSIHPIQMPHGSGQISSRGPDQKMIMCIHEAIGVDFQPVSVDNIIDYLKKLHPVTVIQKDGFAARAAIHNVVPCARKFNSERSGHASSLATKEY